MIPVLGGLLNRNCLLFLLGILILGMVVGFGMSGFVLRPALKPSPQVSPLPEGSRVSFEILTNKVFSNWSAEVGGEIVEKTQSSLTLAKGSDTLIIRYLPGQTIFKKTIAIGDPKKGEFKMVEVRFKDITKGMILRGPVSFQAGEYQPVALVMTIQ